MVVMTDIVYVVCVGDGGIGVGIDVVVVCCKCC